MTLGIFTAMQKEATSFLSDGAVAEKVGQFSFYRTVVSGCNAVLCTPPTVGEIAAAAATQLLIHRYKVDAVLNFGLAGALSDSLAAYDFVYVRDVVHYDMDLTAAGCERGRYPCFDSVAVQADAHLLQRAIAASSFPQVRCASADRFVDTPARRAELRTRFGADVCDMESAAVLFTCRFNQVPCLLVKRISDTVNGGFDECQTKGDKACGDFLSLATLIIANL